MNIDFFSEDTDFNFEEPDIYINWVNAVIEEFNKNTGNISYIFASDKYIRDINVKYLNHDYNTDVITFDYSEDNIISGDIFISIETVQKNADEYQVSFENELQRVMIHGVLHLLGYKDSTDEQKHEMRKAENDCLGML